MQSQPSSNNLPPSSSEEVMLQGNLDYWFVRLLRFFIGTYEKNARATYLQAKYPHLPLDEIAQRWVRLQATNAAIFGALIATAVSFQAFFTIASLGLLIPLWIGTISASIYYLMRVQMRLVLDLALIYGLPLDPNDPEDIIVIGAYALGSGTASALSDVVFNSSQALGVNLVREYISKGTLEMIQAFGREFGLRILQRHFIQYVVPVASIVIVFVWNYFSTYGIGRKAKADFRQRYNMRYRAQKQEKQQTMNDIPPARRTDPQAQVQQNPEPLPPNPYETEPSSNQFLARPTYAPNGGQNQPNFFGCFQNTFALLILLIVVLGLGAGVLFLFFVRDTNNTTENIVDSIAEVFDSEPSVTQIQVRQLILTQNDTRWLESYRETQSIDITAKNDWPGLLPGQRSLSYLAFVTVSAGIDLDLIEAGDIEVRGSEVNIRIPRPQLRDCILDLEQSRYYERNCSAVGVIDAGCGGLEDLLKNRALQTAATENISRIQEEAYESAAETLQDLVETLAGVERVNISVSETEIPLVSEGGTCAVPLPDDNNATVEIHGTPMMMTATPQP